MVRELVITTLRQAKRLLVIVVGFTVLIIGIALIVLPGPAFIVIPLGLVILGTEFIWAKKLLKGVKEKMAQVAANAGKKEK